MPDRVIVQPENSDRLNGESISERADLRNDMQRNLRGTRPSKLETVNQTSQTQVSDWSSPHVMFIRGYARSILNKEESVFNQTVASCLGNKSTSQIVNEKDWVDLIQGAEKASKEGRPLVLLAHSYGNNKALDCLLPELKKRGIDVQVFAMLEASYQEGGMPLEHYNTTVPDNVRSYLNVYSQDLWWNGTFQNNNAVDYSLGSLDSAAQRAAYETQKPGTYFDPDKNNVRVGGGHIGMLNDGNAQWVGKDIKRNLEYLEKLNQAWANKPKPIAQVTALNR